MAISLFKYPRLTHYSSKVISTLTVREQNGHFKPRGLWVSVDSDYGWADWCRGTDYGIEALENAHAVVLKATARIAFLRNVSEMLEFTERFGGTHGDGLWSYFSKNDRNLDWARVAEAFDGILITPYRWNEISYQSTPEIEQALGWYYGWDCASGCIWNPDAVASIGLIEQLERQAA